MKKILFSMFMTLAVMFAFTSCAEDKELTLADLQGATFEGEDADGFQLKLVFGGDDIRKVDVYMAFSGDEYGKPDTYVGYTLVDNKVVIPAFFATIEGDGPKTLLYSDFEGVTMTLKKK